MSWLLKLYPRTGRQRYGAEVAELVASQPRSVQLVIDLVAGAIDAHWAPQAFTEHVERTASVDAGGTDVIARLIGCRVNGQMSRRDQWLSGALTIGGSLVVAGILMFGGDDPMVETFALVMLPGVWHVSTQPFYLRGHSARAKVVLIGGPLVVLTAIAVATIYLNDIL